MRKYCLLLLLMLLMGCDSAGPQLTLDNMAKALETNNTQEFIAQFDIGQSSANYMKDLTRSDDALGSLNVIGNMLGLGNIDELIGNVVDMKSRILEQFNQGVATGEMMAECRIAIKPNCPWVPEALRKASVIQIDKTSAIAKITTPAQISSWLALKLINGKWLVVGRSPLENNASSMVTGATTQQQKPDPTGATRL